MKIQAFALVLLFTNLCVGTNSDFLSEQKFMSNEKAITYFGKKPYEKKAFQIGSRKIRGEMAYSLIKSRALLGKDAEYVKKELGPSDGHFWNDTTPAFLIDPVVPKPNEQWQVVVFLDESSKVKEVRIHKNCCLK